MELSFLDCICGNWATFVTRIISNFTLEKAQTPIYYDVNLPVCHRSHVNHNYEKKEHEIYDSRRTNTNEKIINSLVKGKALIYVKTS